MEEVKTLLDTGNNVNEEEHCDQNKDEMEIEEETTKKGGYEEKVTRSPEEAEEQLDTRINDSHLP